MKNPKFSNQQSKAPQATPAKTQAFVNNIASLVARFQRFARDAAGVAVLALAVMTLLALLLPQLGGGVLLKLWVSLLTRWLGWGSIFIIAAASIAGLALLRRQPYSPPALPAEPADSPESAASLPKPSLKIPWGRIFVLEIGAFACLMLLSILGGLSLQRVEQGLDGGRIGWGLAELLRLALNQVGLTARFWQILVAGLVCLFCASYGFGLLEVLSKKIKAWIESDSTRTQSFPDPLVSVSIQEEQKTSSTAAKRHSVLPSEFRKKLRLPDEAEKSPPPPSRDERLPSLDILASEQPARPDERNINLTAGIIEKTLSEFGIPAKVIGFQIGPTVTQFAVEPGFLEKPGLEEEINKQKVRVAQIASLRRDLALALSAERLRIEAPVPGRPYIGVEVPNMRSTIVRLRPILETEAFYKIGSSLTIALGRNVSGQPVVADLGRMPHLLIAGTTGSGKSVCMAALTTCLVVNNTPQDLRLVMIDPKMVELVRFNGLPHLLGKVETDVERILGVLRWVVVEMDRRYKLLEQMHARDLAAYNRKVQRRKGFEFLPRIVVMIDELADLMMSVPDQTEHTLVRLAQMARATGIHLVIATQRPSTDVVTGLIKANFPARISFAMASAVDSRVILDATGAESLLGHGDMLFMPPEASAPMRCQGVMVSDQEVEKVITFWQQAYPPHEEEPSPWEAMLKEEEVLADKDDLVMKAIAIVRDSQRASASMLQRRLRIGYPRAARLVDELEALGVVGPSQGGGREREVLIGKEDEIPKLKPDRNADKGYDSEEII